MRFLVAAVLYAIPACMTVRWYSRIKVYRIDIQPGESPSHGASSHWLVNVMRSRNYSREGQLPLRRFWFWAGLWQLSVIAAGAVIALS